LPRVRVFRPFPKEEIRKLAERARMIATVDRHISFGMESFLATEVKASIYHMEDRPLVAGFIAGLGDRDVVFKTMEGIARKALKWLQKGRVDEETTWIDLRSESMVTIKGHAACAGCGHSIALRLLFKALGNKVILVVPACCTTVIQGLYPFAAFAVPLQNMLFEATGAVAPGIAAALRLRGLEGITVVGLAGGGEPLT